VAEIKDEATEYEVEKASNIIDEMKAATGHTAEALKEEASKEEHPKPEHPKAEHPN
jgi:hypothetical protein